jgi:hypothetical protein
LRSIAKRRPASKLRSGLKSAKSAFIFKDFGRTLGA